MVQVSPVFFEHQIEVDEEEAKFLRDQGLLRDIKPGEATKADTPDSAAPLTRPEARKDTPPPKDAPKAVPAKEEK